MWRNLVCIILTCSLTAVALAEPAPEDLQLVDKLGEPSLIEGEVDDFGMSNPGSIAEQYIQDREPKEYLFQFPGVDNLLEPWSKQRLKLYEKYGFKPNISFTHLYQWADETVGPEDDASGFELVIDGT